MRKQLVFLMILALILPVLFLGCTGDDGATGAKGAPGDPGDPGAPGPPGPGLQVAEGCLVCHGAGKILDVAEVHAPPAGTATANITSASFNPADNTASVTFTFAATDSEGNLLPAGILTTPSGSNLAYARFTIARLIPGQLFPVQGTRDPDTWFFYGDRSHRAAADLVHNGGGNYTFTFRDVPIAQGEDGYTHRVGIEIYNFSAGVRSVNPTFTFVPSLGAGPYTFAQTRDIVTTAACNECHNPLGYTPGFHGNRRVETEHCVLCHNSNNTLAQNAGGTDVPIPFVKLVHGIHTGQALDIYEGSDYIGDFTEIHIPQDIRNCNKCHKGPDGQNWNTRPSREACGSCHTDVNFATGVGHIGGVQPNNQLCALCHSPAGITTAHLTENATPNNPGVPAGLANFEYFIDNVTVDAAGVASVRFWIKKDGAFLNLNSAGDNVARRPTGFTSGPSFLLAWALPQDNVVNPIDYTNRNSPATPTDYNGNGGGDAPSVSIVGLPITTTDNQVFTARLTSMPFPAGATMRAVAIQSYFTQTAAYDEDGDGDLDDIGRHTPSVVKGVSGDTPRRAIIKSGYDSGTGEPFGCLECHEILELHGGSRVNNVQVCVMCHNPNKSSSGRTVNPAIINSEIIPFVGSDPLVYPEATNNFKEMIHGIHRASDRPYEFVRNRETGTPRYGGFYYNWSHVTFPGDLMDCTKCHDGNSYVPSEIPEGALKTTEKTTTGNSAETRADIIAVRGTVPNDTDRVNSPIASACYYCHDSSAAASHMALNGGKLRAKRTDVFLEFPTP